MKEEYLIGLLCLWIVAMILQAFVHHYWIVIKKSTPHEVEWAITRAMVFVLHGICFIPEPDAAGVKRIALIFLFQITSHTVIFNPLLNKLRFLEYFHISPTSGPIDRWFLKRKGLYITFYFLNVVLFIYTIPLIYRLFL